jgi:hypothetical protein
MNQVNLPNEALHQKLLIFKVLALMLFAITLFTIIAVPLGQKSAGTVVVHLGDDLRLERAEVWKLTPLRYEEFLKKYVSLRFQWEKGDVAESQTRIKAMVDPEVEKKIRDSARAFEELAKNQDAKSYVLFTPGTFAFSNTAQTMEMRVIRVIKIRSVAVATPLIVRMKVKNVALTTENPFGLQVTDLEEVEEATNQENSK